MTAKKTLIFDFDGTLANSLSVVIDLFVTMSRRPRPTIEEIAMYRKLPALQVIRKAHVPLWKLPSLRTKGVRAMALRIQEVNPFEGIPEVLSELSKDYQLLILTSNSVSNSQLFLAHHHLSEYFSGIYTASSIFRKDFSIRKVLALKKLHHNDVLYIGDEARDVEAAHKAGIKIAAVSWGYNDKSILEKYKPDVLVDKPTELLAVTTKLLQ